MPTGNHWDWPIVPDPPLPSTGLARDLFIEALSMLRGGEPRTPWLLTQVDTLTRLAQTAAACDALDQIDEMMRIQARAKTLAPPPAVRWADVVTPDETRAWMDYFHRTQPELADLTRLRDAFHSGYAAGATLAEAAPAEAAPDTAAGQVPS